MRTRIMYVEAKGAGPTGEARIGRVRFSKSYKTVYYRGPTFHRLPGGGAAGSNHFDAETGEEYWISGPKRYGGDRLFGERVPVHVDEDVRAEYWIGVRDEPDRVAEDDASR